MTEQTTRRGAVCPVKGCDQPAEDSPFGSPFPGCAEHGRVFDAQAKKEAWGLALDILDPWCVSTEAIGSPELTQAMEAALRKAQEEYSRAVGELEAAEAALA